MTKLNPTTPALLALEDGSIFYGTSIGVLGQTVGEVVFNTAMTGYQEILTDPSYAHQIVTLTYPHIGNTGTNIEDQESTRVWPTGLIVRDMPNFASSWRMQQSLSEYLQANGVIAMADVDTRRLTRLLRTKGAQNGCIMAGNINEKEALTKARAFNGIKGMDLAKEVSTQTPYTWTKGTWRLEEGYPEAHDHNAIFHVVVYDFGIKHNTLRYLVDHGCRVTVVPAQTPAQDMLALNPDGILLSNGPGDPASCDYAISAIQVFLEKNVPMFGICLGHQLLGLACGAKTIKMKFGHHGANHPVQDLRTGQVMISSQNHGFAIDEATLPTYLKATHRSLFDGSLQGIMHTEKLAFSFQGHPEGGPGPHDVANLFSHFMRQMQQVKTKANPLTV